MMCVKKIIITPVLVRSNFTPYIFFLVFDFNCSEVIDIIVNDN